MRLGLVAVVGLSCLAMDAAKWGGCSCHCFKVASLNQTIMDADRISHLRDRYVLAEQLGWGQFGVIRACTDKFTGEVLACKSIAKERLVTKVDEQSVKLEIEIMTRLSGHPNVVGLKAVYEDEDYVHLVMELCAGGELFHQLEKHGRYSETEARVLFRHLMRVVLYCHDNGVVHRDLKPENILLATTSSSSPIKLADFGLATYIEPGQMLHGTVGSPFYIAPEVLSGGYTQAADVWSAGVILYILLSGTPPFWGKTKSRIFESVRAADLRFPPGPWDQISESAKELVKQMLNTNPLKRLNAMQVLEHAWMKENLPVHEETNARLRTSWVLDSGAASTSAPLMVRSQDISFGCESPAICEPLSPNFTCRSSFSSFLVEPSTPYLVSGGFSFHESSCSPAVEFATPLTSLPSFAFFSPSPVAEPVNHRLDVLDNMAMSDALELRQKAADAKRTGASRHSGIHNKRNRTIGLGEFDQIGLMVTESVIRWASCTNLPTATSLRLSLVC